MAKALFTATEEGVRSHSLPGLIFCKHQTQPAWSKRFYFVPRQATAKSFSHFLLAKLQDRTPYLSTAIHIQQRKRLPNYLTYSTCERFQLLATIKVATPMADDQTPLVASDVDQTSEDKPKGLLDQHRDVPATSLGGHMRETEEAGNKFGNETGEEIAKETVKETANDCEHTPRANSEHTVRPSWENELRQHKSTIKKLTLERDKLEKDSNRNYRLQEAMRKGNDNPERQARDLSLRLTEDGSRFRRQVITFNVEKRELKSEISEAYRQGQLDGARVQLAQNERVVLLQQVEAYKNEAAKWKQEAFGKGSEMFDICWQASIDEAVRREREADSIAMEALRTEIAALKAEKRK
ncbi:hypothetical protein Q7P35_000656 [Cladosporium inversicolor]